MSKAICETEGCGIKLNPRSRLERCENCRGTSSRWKKRRPAEVLNRRSKLNLYTHRIERVIDERGIDE